MALSKKIISVTFRLQTETFTGGGNTITIKGLRTWMKLTQRGGVAMNGVEITIFGMTQSQMNQLSTYDSAPNQNFNNEVLVEAGDASGMSVVFQGTIMFANADYSGMPDAAFVVQAYQGFYQSIAPTPPLSYNGRVSAASIMENLAQTYSPPLTLENGGVNVMITNPYLHGSLLDQIKAVAQAGNFYYYLDMAHSVLAIWPHGSSRPNVAIPLISPTTGLIGYPTFSLVRMTFRTVFNPEIVFGRQVRVQSSLKPANGLWTVFEVTTSLQSETPQGDWFQDVGTFTNGMGGAVPIVG